FGRIRDINGNLLNESASEGVEQFREYFVQQLLIKNDTVPAQEQLMLKNRPLFAEQPIFQGSVLNQYWMNTPLKK
ncbi:MAG: hypothetical protein ACR2MM_11455, partial [Flavobacteriaceae bacterium]